jgi:hypothetical protein
LASRIAEVTGQGHLPPNSNDPKDMLHTATSPETPPLVHLDLEHPKP